MSEYGAVVEWQRETGAAFTDGRYSRGHRWQFDGGAEVAASSSPHSVPLPYSVAANVDPEEAFVAAAASCHMLFFLALAAKAGFVVDRYHDAAAATMGRNADGHTALTRITLNPRVTYHGPRPDPTAEAEWHERAHRLCYIANSINGEIVIRQQAP